MVITELEWRVKELLEVERLKTLWRLEEDALILNFKESEEDVEEERDI